jgi:hypothetical protein
MLSWCVSLPSGHLPHFHRFGVPRLWVLTSTGKTRRPGRDTDVTCAHHQADTGLPVKPLMYGYLRVTDLADDDVQQLECGLRKLAEAEGFCLAEVHYEQQPGCYGTCYRLIAELKQAPVCHLVVPSLDHLSTHPLLREQLLLRLDEANMPVWLVEP